MGRAWRFGFGLLVAIATMTAALTIGAWAATPGSGQNLSATAFVLSGRLTGVPARRKRARRIAAIRVVRVETGEVVADKPLARSLRYKVAVPAGAYVVVGFASDMPGRRGYEVVSRVVRAKAKGHRGLNLRARPVRARASTARRAPSASASAGSVKYVGVAPSMPIAGSQVPAGALEQMLVTDMAGQPCAGNTRLQVLEVKHRQDLIDEIRRSQSPAFDPSTRLTNHLISPRYMVQGGGSQSGGTLQMELHMVDLTTGSTVASANVSGPPDQFFGLYDQLQQSFIESACREDRLPYQYKILDASFETHAKGVASGDVCSHAGIASGGTRDFSGTMTTQPLPAASKLEQPPGSQEIDGSIKAKVAARWTNDHLDGCTFATEDLVPCQLNTPDRSPEPGGAWELVYSLDMQPQTASSITGHWSTPQANIGFDSGGVDPECPFTPFVGGSLSWEETAQSYPASTFTATGPQTISFVGSRHFSPIGGELDYSWRFSITFQRVDEAGNPL